ncbi:helix-turn-helix domain-containing protein [Sporosarcina contaminans]|uniref:Helix-turn-helix domain-containing protein n=1 Tax=Sporosarcina contaminans TaxID=633403 RepID=A0ABW3TWI6_9BACL
MNVGNRIRNLREMQQLSVTQLAKEAYISQPYLSDIERGRHLPSLDKLKTICDALNITLGEFFGDQMDLTPDLLRLVENARKLSEYEREKLNDFIEALAKRDLGDN